MKLFPVTLTVQFEIEASNYQVALKRVDALLERLLETENPTLPPFPKWWPDHLETEIDIDDDDLETEIDIEKRVDAILGHFRKREKLKLPLER